MQSPPAGLQLVLHFKLLQMSAMPLALGHLMDAPEANALLTLVDRSIVVSAEHVTSVPSTVTCRHYHTELSAARMPTQQLQHSAGGAGMHLP